MRKFILLIVAVFLFFSHCSIASAEEIETDLLSNTLFLGDSLTVGINNTVDLESYGAVVDAKVSRNINQCSEAAKKYTNFKRVIIGIGTNNYGTEPSTFSKQYQELIDIVVANNPEADIFINTIPGVNEVKAKHCGYYIKNYHVDEKNSLIKELATSNKLYCMDINTYLGEITMDDTSDGLHMNGKIYEKWFNFINSEVMRIERHKIREQAIEINLVPETPPARELPPKPEKSFGEFFINKLVSNVISSLLFIFFF